MKNHFLVFIFLMSLYTSYSQAQQVKESSILPLLNEGELLYKELVDKYMTIARFEIDLVNLSSNKLTPIKLISDKTYSVLLIGESDVINEIELKIYSNVNGSRLLEKYYNNSARKLESAFKPGNTDFYEFEIIAKKSAGQNQAGRYCLIIAY